MLLGMGNGGASSGGSARVPVDMCACPSCLRWGEPLPGRAAGRKAALPAKQAKREQQATSPLQLQVAVAAPSTHVPHTSAGAPRLKELLEDVWDWNGNPVHPVEHPFGAQL